MKRLIAFFFILFFKKTCFTQSFEKGNIYFDMKIDFAGYKGMITDNQTLHSFNAGAASIMLSPQFDWASGKKISIGTSVCYSHYLDSSRAAQKHPALNGLDANFIFDFHFIRNFNVDMMAGLKLGIAGVRYNPKDGTGNIYGSMGTVSDIHCSARFSISEKIGVLANIGFPGYRYVKFGKNINYTSSIVFRGFCIGTGVTINLTPKKE
jgi:hypothetical protein